MRKKEQEALLSYIKAQKHMFHSYLTPTKYSWRIGYNQALFDISQYIKSLVTPRKESVVKGLAESDIK